MDEFRFYHPIEIRYGDLDPQGHVNNACFLTFFEQARVSYLIHLGLFSKNQSFLEVGIIIAEAKVTYLAPVHYGQDIQVGVRVNRIGNKSMLMQYCLVDTDTATVHASGETIVVAFDYRAHQTIPVPADWREKITRFEGLNA